MLGSLMCHRGESPLQEKLLQLRDCTGLRQSTPPSSEISSDGPDLQDDNTQPSNWTPVRRRENEEDDHELASSQESCEDDAPREKRLRSDSPSPQQIRDFHPEVFLSQSNTNVNDVRLQSFQTSTIQINLNLNRGEDHRADSELDSEDFLA